MTLQDSLPSSEISIPEHTTGFFASISSSEWQVLGAWLAGSLALAMILWFVVSRISRTQTTDETSKRKRRALRTASVGVGLISGLSLLFYGIWTTVGDRLPDSFQTSIPFIVLAVLATWLAQRFSRDIISYVVERYSKPGDNPRSAALSTSALEGIVRASVIVIGILIILSLAGVPISPLFAALGAIGVGFALGAQSLIERWIGGLQIAFAEHIMPGQYIEIDGQKGHVEDIKSLHTVLRTLGGDRIVFPNEQVVSAVVKNHTLDETVTSAIVEAGVSYSSDLEHVESVVMDVAKQTMDSLEQGAESAEPFMRFKTFGDSNITFKVYLKARSYTDQFVLKHEFIKALKQRFDKEGIDMPFPIRDVRITNK